MDGNSGTAPLEDAGIFNLLDIPIRNVSMTKALEMILEAVDTYTPLRGAYEMHFVNAHCINVAARQEPYLEILKQARAVFADGTVSAMQESSWEPRSSTMSMAPIFSPCCVRNAPGWGNCCIYLVRLPVWPRKLRNGPMPMWESLSSSGIRMGSSLLGKPRR